MTCCGSWLEQTYRVHWSLLEATLMSMPDGAGNKVIIEWMSKSKSESEAPLIRLAFASNQTRRNFDDALANLMSTSALI